MKNKKHKVIVAITGASGSIYAVHLLAKLEVLKDQIEDVAVIFSVNGKKVWEHETGDNDFKEIPFSIYPADDFFAPFASGSANYDIMIVCPCSMGTLGKIANGVTDDLITRAADVALKERRRLILVTREMPVNLVHITNMRNITLAGGIICPASPSFYSRPDTVESLINTVTDRILNLAGFDIDTFHWGENA